MVQETTPVGNEIARALDALLPVSERINQELGLRELTMDEIVSGIIGLFNVKEIKITDPERLVRTQLPTLMEQRGYHTKHSNPDYDGTVFVKVD